MSYTEIYGIKNNGEVAFVNETKNAWRGAMHVWNRLCEKYEIKGAMFGGFQELWKMANTGALADFENTVLKSTFDNVVVKKEEIPMLLEAFREYDKHFPESSLVEQAEIIENEILNDDEFMGVCWNQTSVNRNPWLIETEPTEDDEEEEEDDSESAPYNILSGEKHWFLT